MIILVGGLFFRQSSLAWSPTSRVLISSTTRTGGGRRGVIATSRTLSLSIKLRNQLHFSKLLSTLSAVDEEYMRQAISIARKGLTHTFPNPAVGCVLVENETGRVLGAGFHPRAGYPHAEVFALLEAAGHVPDGVAAAEAVVGNDTAKIDPLLSVYMEDGGAGKLFGGCFKRQIDNNESSASEFSGVTAYVTLEPCCHKGKTPPCATSLVLAQASRVVVGFRDPNPRVDGGGVKVLEDAGIEVVMAEGSIRDACQDVVKNFVKRIMPKEEIEITGAMRRQLRALANRQKKEKQIETINWSGKTVAGLSEEAIAAVHLAPNWMEHIDDVLWREELVLLRLNNAVEKKKSAKLLGERIASELGAHVAQTLGHTVLLYRPGFPPVLDIRKPVSCEQ